MIRHRLHFTLGLMTLAAALAGCGGGAGDAGGPHEAGLRAYQNTCLACHGADGGGHPPRQPALAGSGVVKGDVRTLARWIMLGERTPGWSPPPGSMPMPRFAWLGDADLAALLSYIRAEFGPNASPVTAQDIAAARRAP